MQAMTPTAAAAADGAAIRRPTRWSGWLTPGVCRILFAGVMVANVLLGWRFLTHRCPIDLSGDEAQYWTWSRHPALGYYSKGPLVAWIIHASCAVLGDTMPAVRAPALLLAVGTTCCTYWLTRFLFASDRLALGAVLLGGIVPMFAAGGTLMTIDPPMFFGWAVATCLIAKAIFDGTRWAWPAAGLAIGTAALAKYGALLWLPLVLTFLAIDRPSRRWLRLPGPWVTAAVALACLTPPAVWNARHGWVTFAHVSAQVGGEHGGRSVGAVVGDLLGFVGTQAAAVNPALCVFVVAAVVHAVRDGDRATRFLLVLGGGFWLVCLADNLLAKVQPNWPAPAYFTLLILTAHFIATRRRRSWKPWRGWFWGAVVFGLVAGFLVRDPTVLFPAVRWVNRTFPRANGDPRLTAKAVDGFMYKLRGVRDPFATTVAADLARLKPGAFVLCEDYMDASQLAFYLPGQPDTYFAGSYWTDETVRRRWTQYDLWPDRQLDRRPGLIGRDAVYVGWPNYAPLRQSFASVTPLPDVVVRTDGLEVRRWKLWRCTAFRGMSRPPGRGPR